MKTGRLRKATSFWKSLFFMGNICKMRKSMMNYLTEEGLKCDLVDGDIVFEFNDCHFCTSFNLSDDYAECTICYRCEDDDYEKLDMNDKTFMADGVNTDMENHATVYAFNDSILVATSFYFTNENMMIDLFSKHFEELTSSIDEAIDIVCAKMEDQKKVQSRRIGFNVDSTIIEDAEPDLNQVAAKA